MRRSLFALCSIGLLAACGGETPAHDVSTPISQVDAIRAAAVSRAREEPGVPRKKPLDTPLPNGVLPDFDYNATVDMSTRMNVVIRQVHLDLPNLSAQEAMDRMVAQFEAAGLAAGEQRADKETLLRSVWTPSADGAKGMAVVDSGGTWVVLMARDYPADSERRADGYVAMLTMQINSK